MKMKRVFSIIMCVAMLLTVIPFTASATSQEEKHPYCEIKFKEGCKEELSVGETTEIYVDYYADEYEEYEVVVWTYSRYVCEMECITDENTGLATGAKITALQEGVYYPVVSIKASDGTVIAQDIATVRVSAVDERTFFEKVSDWFKLLPSNVFMSLYLALFAGGSMALSVFDIPKIAADWINGLYEEIKEGVYI